ncbi:hypothetical protein C8R47DRAFT_189001 [Mycena vitilis]|nr:hypothetical protein C8R47DRAFT_189001 [Mycena vitilis]
MQTPVAFEPSKSLLAPERALVECTERDITTYPVLTLPPEIVAEIFKNFLPIYPKRPPPTGIFSPLMLCRICGMWRQIALSTPALWQAIGIELREQEDRQAWGCRLDILETWLARSGDCPLSVTLHYHLQSSYGSRSDSELTRDTHLLWPFIRSLVRHCRRWEYLDLIMPLENLSIIRGDMPWLRDLIFGPSDLPADDERTILQLFERAPHLSSVVLTECFVPSNMLLPWSQLTHLEGLCLYQHECVEILSHTTNLIHCTMTICGSPEPEIPMPTVPVLYHLRDLVLLVTEASDVTLANILDILTLPALRTLQFPEPCMDRPLETLQQLILRSMCMLDELHVIQASLPEASYRQAVPSARRIALYAIDRLATPDS